MVFQNYALYPHMTVGENMGFALKIAGESQDEINKRVDEAAATLGLTDQCTGALRPIEHKRIHSMILFRKDGISTHSSWYRSRCEAHLDIMSRSQPTANLYNIFTLT